jgi:tRNA modification GTPase
VDRTTRKALELFEHTRRSADLVMWVVDGSRGSWGEVPEGAGLLVLTHADRGSCVESVPRGLRSVRVCAPEGSGLDELAARVANLLGMEGARAPESGAALSILSARNLEALERVHWALQEADNLLVAGPGLDLAAEAVRGALTALDELTARCTPEDVLERIFSRFCLGK